MELDSQGASTQAEAQQAALYCFLHLVVVVFTVVGFLCFFFFFLFFCYRILTGNTQTSSKEHEKEN